MSLSPAVRAGFLAWTDRFEGAIAWPCLDVRGLVTIAAVLNEPAEGWSVRRRRSANDIDRIAA